MCRKTNSSSAGSFSCCWSRYRTPAATSAYSSTWLQSSYRIWSIRPSQYVWSSSHNYRLRKCHQSSTYLYVRFNFRCYTIYTYLSWDFFEKRDLRKGFEHWCLCTFKLKYEIFPDLTWIIIYSLTLRNIVELITTSGIYFYFIISKSVSKTGFVRQLEVAQNRVLRFVSANFNVNM